MARIKITVEDTPNPQAMKFTVHRPVDPAAPMKTRSFPDPAAAADDPLAAALFALPGVTNVMYVSDFVTVNKTPTTRWKPLIKAVTKTLQDHLPPV